MADTPINLNKARKAKARTERRTKADRNAILHGMSRAERAALRADEARRKAIVDGARRDRGDADETE